MSNFIIGLTGGIGSGKTTVSNMFADLAIDIIDADIVAREVVEPGSTALATIANHFGADYINDQQQLDRGKLRTRIFNHPKDKLWLNNLLHPLIRQEMLKQLSNAQSDYCILVAPLLLENGLDKLVSRVLVIDIDEECQVTRTLARDTSSQQEIERIIASQIPRNERLSSADDVIDNQNLTLEQVRQRVQLLHQYYLSCEK